MEFSRVKIVNGEVHAATEAEFGVYTVEVKGQFSAFLESRGIVAPISVPTDAMTRAQFDFMIARVSQAMIALTEKEHEIRDEIVKRLGFKTFERVR